jgi:hypothetical protein
MHSALVREGDGIAIAMDIKDLFRVHGQAPPIVKSCS